MWHEGTRLRYIALVVGLGYRSGLAASNFLPQGMSRAGSTLRAGGARRHDRRPMRASSVRRVPGARSSSGSRSRCAEPGVPRSIPRVTRRVGEHTGIAESSSHFVSAAEAWGDHRHRRKSTTTAWWGTCCLPRLRALVGATSVSSRLARRRSSDDTERYRAFVIPARDDRALPAEGAAILKSHRSPHRYASGRLFPGQARVAMNQSAGDSFVYNMDIPSLRGIGNQASRRLAFR